jgi:uncharacterized integral membrane protein
MKMLRRLLTLALMAGAFVVAYQFGKNAEPVTVRLFEWSTPAAPAWLVIAVAFGAGVLLASGLWLFQVIRLSLLGRRYRKELAALEGELHKLRNLPLAEDGGAAVAAPAGGSAAVASEGPRG